MLAASMHHNVLSKRAFLTLRAKKREEAPLSACQAGAYHYCICFSAHAYARTDTSARAQFLDRYPCLLPRVYTQSAYA